jgi:hypothetical protein
LLITALNSLGQCPTTVTISANKKCIPLIWNTPPNPLPATIIFETNTYTWNSGVGTSANPAIYITAGGQGCNNYVGLEGTLEINGQSCTYIGGVLPLKLLDFSASKTGSSIELKWQTSDEHLVRDFQIERASADFDWQVISIVDFNRSLTDEAKTYFFNDKNPVNGKNYYRLKISDYDGYSEYSKLVSSDFKRDSKNISLYPNPVEDILYISNENTADIQSIEIYNPHGKKMQEYWGLSDFIDVSGLSTGIFMAVVTLNDNTTVIKKFIR